MPAYPTLVVNGVNMYDTRWALADDQSLRELPGRRGFSVTVPGRSGVITPARTVRDSSVFTVSLWVAGFGSTPAERVADLERTLWALDFLFANNGEMFPVQYVAGPMAGDVLEAQCRRISSTSPDRAGGGDVAKVSFVLEIPSGQWRDPLPRVGKIAWPWTNPFVLTEFTGSANEITDAQIALEGPFANAQIQDPRTGQYIHFAGSGTMPRVNAGQTLRLDLATMSARYINGLDWNPTAGVDCSSWITNGGPGAGRSWLPLVPRMYGVADPTVRTVMLEVAVSVGMVAPATPTANGTRFHYRGQRSF